MKIENLTMNRNWVRIDNEYIEIISWNKAIEAAALCVGIEEEMITIRKLKK